MSAVTYCQGESESEELMEVNQAFGNASGASLPVISSQIRAVDSGK